MNVTGYPYTDEFTDESNFVVVVAFLTVRGHVTLRYLGRLRYLNVGWGYRGQPIRLYVVDDHVDVVTEDGELVGEITLNPERDYQPIIRNHST